MEFTYGLSPTDGRLVFNKRSRFGMNLFLLEPAGKIRQITDERDFETDPSFSPDGNRIVFAAGEESSGGDHLEILDLRTGKRRQLTDFGGNDSVPRFSPDGLSILFLHQDGHADAGMTPGWQQPATVYAVSVDGSQPRELKDATPPGAPNSGGRSIFYQDEALRVFRVDGKGIRNQVPTDFGSSSLSPDHKIFVYEKRGYGPVYLWQASRQKPAELLPGEGCMKPAFSYDGRWIYYLQNYGMAPLLWKVHANGKGHERAGPVDMFTDTWAVGPGRR
jgi:Tol biopolymer transport system component